MAQGITTVLDKISRDYEMRKARINVASFISACDFVENAQVIANLAYVLANKDMTVCIVDFKVFYPNLYYWLSIEPNKKGEGLMRMLKNYRNDIKSVINQTSEKNVFLLSPSPYDSLESYYSFEFRHIETVINVLRENFDIVLIDVPNNPPLEFCLGAMMNCMQGFFIAAERIDVLSNMIKLLHHAGSIGISEAKFLDVIFMNSQNTAFDYAALRKSNFSVTAQLPFVKEAWESSLKGRIYLRDAQIVNKTYVKEIQKIADKFI
ncbi:MAG: ATPase [Clostridiales bacterium]|jgi:MinD-like ATPase involved in chromosome partitioning or flagellar assembly|nr:ATPase [Clostridiales bacterium]